MARRSGGWSLTRDATSGIYGVRFRIDGARRHLSTGSRDPREARETAARLYAAALSGRRAVDTRAVARAPLADLTAEWLASLATTHDPETGATYELYVGTHWLACWRRHLQDAPLVRGIPKSVTGTRSAYRPRKRAPVLLTPDEAELVIAAMPERTTRGGTPRAWARVAWETGLRHATLAALRAPDDYRVGAAVLVVRAEADKSRFARVLPLTLPHWNLNAVRSTERPGF